MKIEKQNKILHILDSEIEMENVIRKIAENQENSFYVCNVDRIVRNFKIFKDQLPRLQPFYSVKCNNDPTVLEILAALGSGFNCASKTEINKILNLVDTEKIVFANPAKIASHIRHAASMGVNLMSFDNEVELHKIREYHQNAKLLIRVRATDTEEETAMKFGCDPVTEAPNLLLVAKSLGVDVVGVSVHFDSEVAEAKVLQKAIASAKEIFDFATNLGYDFDVLDFGDCIPVEEGTVFDKVTETINSALETFFPQYNLKVLADPSRFLVNSAFTLTCSVNFIRTISSEQTTNRHCMYFINDGVYGNFGNILTTNQPLKVKTLKPSDSGDNVHISSIWGPICDDLDNVVQEILLPELEVGDLVCFEDMGAYTLSLAGGCNGFPKTKVFVVATEEIWLRLKVLLPMIEERLENENIPHKFQMDSNIHGGQDWSLPSLPITIKLPRCGDGALIEEHVLDYVTTCRIE